MDEEMTPQELAELARILGDDLTADRLDEASNALRTAQRLLVQAEENLTRAVETATRYMTNMIARESELRGKFARG